MELSPSSQRAKSAREHRHWVRRLKIAAKMNSQTPNGQVDTSPQNIKRRRGENVYEGGSSAAAAAVFSASCSAVPTVTQSGDAAPTKEESLPTYGCAAVCGRRWVMEDAITVAPQFISPDLDFFSVYDGHGGCTVAQTCAERLHHLLRFEMQRRWACDALFNWEEVMEDCFLKMDDEVGGKVVGVHGITAGSTAVVAVVGPRFVIVANCGDSRAILSRERTTIQLTNDHKPNRPDEMQRIEALGGTVISWGGARVLGVLATSRSIGDHYLKPYVIPNPEVFMVERTEVDEFLILASDGLWDVVSNEIACEVVWRCFVRRSSKTKKKASKKSGAEEAASKLIELAMGRGSQDNVSVVVVDLRSSSGAPLP